MKIYTKTGDSGETSLVGGTRVPKDHDRIEAYGNVDELNSAIGMVRSLAPPADVDTILGRIQEELFVLGADLAAPQSEKSSEVPRVSASDATRIEGDIDRFEGELPPLKNFVLPSGNAVASALHMARTICRRAERKVVRLKSGGGFRPETVVYLNRLSDLLFVLARVTNRRAGVQESVWKGKSG